MTEGAITMNHSKLCEAFGIEQNTREWSLLEIVCRRLPDAQLKLSPEEPGTGGAVAAYNVEDDTIKLRVDGRGPQQAYVLAHEIIHAADFTTPGSLVHAFWQLSRERQDHERHTLATPGPTGKVVDEDNDPYRIIARGLSELNSHLVQGAKWCPGQKVTGTAGGWGHTHCYEQELEIGSHQGVLLPHIESYLRFMNGCGVIRPNTKDMEEQYRASLIQVWGELFAVRQEEFEPLLAAFLKDHVTLRTQLALLERLPWYGSNPEEEEEEEPVVIL